MPRATRDVEKALSKKGFTLVADKDHNYYYVYKNGKKTSVNTKVSHGYHKDISDGLLNQMRKQIRLPKHEFEEYMNCTFSKEQYLEFLENNGHI